MIKEPLAVVTGNEGKFMEIKSVLSELGIGCYQHKAQLNEFGDTLEEVVRHKAEQAWELVKAPLIVDDTGMFFEAYKDFPGHLSKRVFNSIGYEGLFKLLENKSRKAYFKTLICYTKTENDLMLFEGTLKGKITENVHDGGLPGFPYDRIFIPDGFDKPFSYMPLAERTRIDHRSDAVRKFVNHLIKVY